MNKNFVIGIILIGISFFSLIPVLCNEISNLFGFYCTTWEFFYTFLPISSALFLIGIFLLVKSYRKFSLKNKSTKNILVIVMIIFVFSSSIVILVTYQPFFVEIVGIKHEYRIGEPIMFSVKTRGIGNVCPDPNISIVRIDSTWPIDGTNIIWDRTFPACVNSEYKFFNYFWNIDQLIEKPIIINDTGTFELRVSYGNREVDKKFIIIR